MKMVALNTLVDHKFCTICFFLFFIFLFSDYQIAAAQQVESDIQYLNKQSEKFKALLTPEPARGVLLQENKEFTKVFVDGRIVKHDFVLQGSNQAKITGKLPTLKEGKHDALAETYSAYGATKDRSQRLFFIDTTPPKLQLINKDDLTTPVKIKTLSFLIVEAENGSGVSTDPQENNLQVSATGATIHSHTITKQHGELHLNITLELQSPALLAHEKQYGISISLTDRARNSTTYSNNFSTRALVKAKYLYRTCESSSDLASIEQTEFMVRPNSSIISLQDKTTETFGLFLAHYFGVNYTFPRRLRSMLGLKKVTFEAITFGDFFINQVQGHIVVSSDSRYLSVTPLPRTAGSRLEYQIKQTEAAPFTERVAYLTVRYPNQFEIAGKVNYCQASYKSDEAAFKGYSKAPIEFFPENAFRYKQETLTIPVYLKTTPLAITSNYNVQDGTVYWYVTSKDSQSLTKAADLNSSYFELAGQKAWFMSNSNGLQAKISSQEGLKHFRTAVSFKASDKTFLYEDDMLVALDPPSIEQIGFNRANNTLSALISDEGTPLEELEINVTVDGVRQFFDYDPASGNFVAHLPDASDNKVMRAKIEVIDKAGQKRIKSINAFGKITDTQDSSTGKPTNSRTSSSSLISGTADTSTLSPALRLNPNPLLHQSGKKCNVTKKPPATVLSSSSDGYSNVRVCKEVLQMGVCYKGELYSSAPDEMKKEYAQTNSYQDDYKNISFPSEQHIIQDCQIKQMDILSPEIINPQYNTATGQITATLRDNGARLDGIKVTATVYTPSNHQITGNVTLSADRLSGKFNAHFPAPVRIENFTITISAQDRAKNSSSARIEVKIPRFPPILNLELVNTGSTHRNLSFNNRDISAYFRTSAEDESGVNTQTIGFSINRVKFPALYTSFSPYTHDGYPLSLHSNYGALLPEGKHKALFNASDSFGLSSQATLDFTLSFPPQIYNFVSSSDVIQRNGGPALSAMILDSKNDVEHSGLSLTIDGKHIDPVTYYFEPDTGYFALDGPLHIASGLHTAKLTATDNQGNSTDEYLRFLTGSDLAIPPSSSGAVKIDQLTIWELKNSNGDGEANPGEYVRLFVSLENQLPYALDACSATLRSEDTRINVETDSVSYNHFSPNSTYMPLHGFDLNIGSDILNHTTRDQYDAHCYLKLKCDEGKDVWDLPLTVPIHEPSLPIAANSTVQVRFDPTPSSINATTVTIHGTATSSNSYMDEVTVLVNGTQVTPVSLNTSDGTFEASVPLEEGGNVIEIQAYDQSGATGSATTVVNCVGQLEVKINKPPKTTNDSQITVTGSVRCITSAIAEVRLYVNGQREKIHYNVSTEKFDAVIHLQPGVNTIAVEADSDTGLFGQAMARVNCDDALSIKIDKSPKTTTEENMRIEGVARSSASDIINVSVSVNGHGYDATYNSSTHRFSKTVPLEEGGNVIEAEAINTNHEKADDSTYITRIIPVSGPSLSITSPVDGEFVQCAGPHVTGTYDTGGAMLGSITVTVTNTTDPGRVTNCGVTITGANSFEATCGNTTPGGADHRVDATIQVGGEGEPEGSAADAVIITTGFCS